MKKYLLVTLLLVLAAFITMTLPSCKTKKSATENTTGVIQEKLLNTHWNLIELDGKYVNPDQSPNTLPFLEILEDGTVNADDGCNRLFGPVELGKDGSIHFGTLASSMRACPGQTLETPFRKALSTCDRFEINGGILSLMQGKKTILARFEAAPKSED